ncbi:MAG: hypothetical protein ING71_02780 [Rhodocyclaceae bacterium]|nr:hypothetical protein [Rhodocyclaceae bacterium]
MTVFVFSGPSLSPEEVARRLPDAVSRYPAGLGDIYDAVMRSKVSAIVLIDGFFHQQPAVWHKEILFALDQGIPVLGASSMGALRAAELNVFGMLGSGAVYRAYRDGLIEDDDEVAVTHGPAETGFTPLSIALVSVRLAMQEMVAEGRLQGDLANLVLGEVKALHYPKRTWRAVQQAACGAGLAQSEADALIADLRKPSADFKRRDALEALEQARMGLSAPGPGPRTEPSTIWTRFTQDRRVLLAGDEIDDIISWIGQRRVAGGTDVQLLRDAALLLLSLSEVKARGKTGISFQSKRVRHRRRALGLLTPAGFSNWLSERSLDVVEFDFLACVDEMVARLQMEQPREFAAAVALEARRQGIAVVPHPLPSQISEQEVADWINWYEQQKPLGAEPDAYLRSLGFSTIADFIRSLGALYDATNPDRKFSQIQTASQDK